MGFENPDKGKSFTFVQIDQPLDNLEIGDTWWDGGPISNLLLYSEDLTQANWLKVSSPTVIQAVDLPPACLPTYLKTWKLTDNSNSASSYVYQQLALGNKDILSRCASIYIKNVDSLGFKLVLANYHDGNQYGTPATITFNFATNTPTIVGNAIIQKLPDNWYRVSLILNDDGTADGVNDYVRFMIYPASLNGITDTGSIIVCAPQLEYGLGSSKVYLSTTSAINSITGKTCIFNGTFWQCKDLNIKVNGGDFGYIANGYRGTTFAYANMLDSFQFPFDSGSTKFVGNTATSGYVPSYWNSSQYGYIGCGYGTTIVNLSSIQRFSFNQPAASALVGNASASRYPGFGFNSSMHGYIAGGDTSTSTAISVIDRLLHSLNSGNMSAVGTLTAPKGGSNAGLNSSQHGFIIGGESGAAASAFSNVERLQFPFDSGVTSSVGNLSYTARYTHNFNSSLYGFSCNAVYGYPASTPTSRVDRVAFPFNSGSLSNVGSLTNSKSYCGGLNSTIAGYCTFGLSGSTHMSNVDKIQFPFDSGVSVLGGVTSPSYTNLYGHAAIDNTDFVAQFV